MKPSRPNIIIVTTDQQRADSLRCYGSPFVHTPHLDRLAAEGVILDRAYCTNPVCTPARASIFSGQCLSRHGTWNVGVNVPEDVPLLSHYVSALGYRTHYVGKIHFQAYGGGEYVIQNLSGGEKSFANWHGPYYGFETVEKCMGHATWGLRGHYGLWLQEQFSPQELQALCKSTRVGTGIEYGGEAYDWDLPTRLHHTVWVAERSIEFLKKQDKSQPFFLAIGFRDPHHPHCVPKDFEDRVSSERVPPPRYQEGELEDKPPHYKLAREGKLEGSPFRGAYEVAGQGAGADYRTVSEADGRFGRAYYYTLVQLIDREMGRVLDCLKEQGLAENTLVIFTTDHGDLLGDHGLWMKGPFHYEELVRIPFLMRWPAGLSGGRRIGGLFSQVDIVPTALAAVGGKIPESLDGVNALPLFRGETGSVREQAVIECVDDPHRLRLKTVVTDDWKLTYYHGEEFGELYDLRHDPGEIRNLWNDNACAQTKQRLLGKLLDHMERMEHRAPRVAYA